MPNIFVHRECNQSIWGGIGLMQMDRLTRREHKGKSVDSTCCCGWSACRSARCTHVPRPMERPCQADDEPTQSAFSKAPFGSFYKHERRGNWLAKGIKTKWTACFFDGRCKAAKPSALELCTKGKYCMVACACIASVHLTFQVQLPFRTRWQGSLWHATRCVRCNASVAPQQIFLHAI